jgi:phytoene synthase
LASIEIFGYQNPATRDYAVDLGLALQLTNILRDVAVDAARDRLYIPLEDLERFRISETQLLEAAAAPASRRPPGVRALLLQQADRAREHYARAHARLPREDRRSMLAAEIMGAVYRVLLEELIRRDFPWTPPLRLSRPRKAFIALRTVPRVYWGL